MSDAQYIFSIIIQNTYIVILLLLQYSHLPGVFSKLCVTISIPGWQIIAIGSTLKAGYNVHL